MCTNTNVEIEQVSVEQVEIEQVLNNPEKYVAEALCNPDLSYSETIELFSQWIGEAHDEGWNQAREQQ